jgi:sterol desaturase/sphingolipid hydroxylase (fatty acid hydroxylase superfamily)
VPPARRRRHGGRVARTTREQGLEEHVTRTEATPRWVGVDLTVLAVPFFFGAMALEHRVLTRRAAAEGRAAPSDYERRDTLASLSMGVGSLIAPLVMPKLLGPVTPGRGRWGRALIGTVVGGAAVTTAADVIARRAEIAAAAPGAVPSGPVPSGAVPTDDERTDGGPTGDGALGADVPAATTPTARSARVGRLARRVAGSAAVTTVAAGITAAATTWATRTAVHRVWNRRSRRRDLGAGVLAVAGAIAVWDFIYYWNHRAMHESRWLWAIHVVHHSSERYNLSTALRQPVADAFGVFVPYGLMAGLGFRPELIETARGVNLLYQFWIHTDAIERLGAAEAVLNTPSHHRVHHGSNRRYLDRNHGSILILWDRLFGTFQREDEPVVYGLTRNIHTYNPLRIATHEHADMLRDVARARTWRDRLGYVLRGPGWAYRSRVA